jgi:chemotaxis protein methyltransferase CheR
MLPAWAASKLARREFTQLTQLIEEASGLVFGPGKQALLEGRLRRRLRALELGSFVDYLEVLADPVARQRELPNLIDCVTTNHTSFWREPKQFVFLRERGIAQLAAGAGEAPLRAWSAGCSSGEEPYTLAMVLAEATPDLLPRGFSILATDISRTVLTDAIQAIYREEEAKPLPAELRIRYLMRSRERAQQLVRVVPELRRLVSFELLNLLETTWSTTERFELIFCRNVLIYFDTPRQQQVLRRLTERLRPGGILCLGHSDNSMTANLPIRQLQANTYQRI